MRASTDGDASQAINIAGTMSTPDTRESIAAMVTPTERLDLARNPR
jgi:hypothetical protein